ncbi:MAG: tRNA 2-thiocytidine(32) synthetase TtcA, partial [Spirochaetes bacterium]|nr:tRNA 2-thiocytidine(32) synthetase TtcA [Spirochaetota bacterium]
MNDLYDKFRKHVLDNSLIVSGDRVLLSVSAGKDSMAMLHMTQRLKD